MRKSEFLWYTLHPISSLCIGLVYIYKGTLSRMLPETCRFIPTCSTYMIQSIREWGFIGVILGTKRLFRCRPHGRVGEDWVPFNIKGEKKWIF